MTPLFPSPQQLLRRRLVRRVQQVFNDTAAGEAPVRRSDDAYFAPGSVIRRVHADVTAMMAGGIAALLMQMLHPLALAGVLGHSAFRSDMLGRLRRTSRFIAATTYGERAEADAAIARVRAIHARVRGTAPDGRSYSADDPHLLAWIHVVEALFFLAAHLRYVEPDMPRSEQDAYFAEFALVASRLGADPVPETLDAASALFAEFRLELEATARTHEVAGLILNGTGKRPGTLACAARRGGRRPAAAVGAHDARSRSAPGGTRRAASLAPRRSQPRCAGRFPSPSCRPGARLRDAPRSDTPLPRHTAAAAPDRDW